MNRAELAKKLAEVMPLVARSAPLVQGCTLAHGGQELDDASRRDLLQRLAAGEVIELTMEIIAFRQKAGVSNRNFTRFQESKLTKLGKSGKGTPFLKDHNQRDVESRGGTVVASKMETADDGERILRQTVRLTAAWAVRKALEGNLDRYSIGWIPTGPVLCSACGEEILCKEWHWPGDRLESGERVEWIFTDAELIESSGVNVPAVLGTELEEIRAALSAAQNLGREPNKEQRMDPKMKAALLSILALSASADDAEIVRAAEALRKASDDADRRLSTLQASLEEVKASLETEAAARQAAEELSRQREEDSFVAAAIKAGKVKPKSKLEACLRKEFAADKAAAREHVDDLPRITPVGQERQSGGDDPAEKSTVLGAAEGFLADCGVDASRVRAQLKRAGVKDPDAALSRHIGEQLLAEDAA